MCKPQCKNVPIPKEKQKNKGRNKCGELSVFHPDPLPQRGRVGEIPAVFMGNCRAPRAQQKIHSHGGAEGLVASREEELLELPLCPCINGDIPPRCRDRPAYLYSDQLILRTHPGSFNQAYMVVALFLWIFSYYLFIVCLRL